MPRSLRRNLDSLEDRWDALRGKVGGRRTDPIHVLPYRGYGTRERLWIKGRVLEREVEDQLTDGGGVLQNLRAMLRRYESDEVPGAKVELALGERRHVVTADEEGYFEIELDASDATAPWTDVPIRLLEPRPGEDDGARAIARVRVPGPRARRLVVSDLDDTVVKTGARSWFRHARTVLLNDARSREPFAGVAPFYRALERGPDGGEDNPIFYLSSSPWNLFDLFERFLETHAIPLGPILLKDFGIDEKKFLKEDHVAYKLAAIERILGVYPGLELVLLGDRGQRDAVVFEKVIERHPERVAAVYVRDLAPHRDDRDLAAIEGRVAQRGVTMIRVADTARAAEHACEQSWISADQLAEVQREVRRQPS